MKLRPMIGFAECLHNTSRDPAGRACHGTIASAVPAPAPAPVRLALANALAPPFATAAPGR
jgi:hypothetical protein